MKAASSRARKIRAVALATAAFAALAAPSGAFGASRAEKAEIARYLDQAMERYGIVGMAASVRENGKPVFENAYGLASMELGVPVTPETVFQISSITKLFTDALLCLLVEDGVLSFDAPIGDYVDGLPESWRGLPVWRLMSHTSGLPDYIMMEPLPATVDDAFAALKDKPFDFPTGEGSRYNQTNFLLLKLAAERVTGEAFTDVVAERLLKPAGLSSARFGAKYAVVPGRATSYRPVRGGLELRRDFDWPDYLFSAAGLNISLADFDRWLAALTQGEIVRKETLARAWAPVTLKDGSLARHSLGWEYEANADVVSVGHDGARMTDARHFIAKDGSGTVSVVVLTNGAKTFFNPQDVAEGLAEVLIDGAQGPDEKLSDDLYRLLAAGDVKGAEGRYRAFLSSAEGKGADTERMINDLGYEFLRRDAAAAIALFELNAESHPDSANAWDSLGEAYAVAKDAERSIEAYEKSLELNPENENARAMLEQLRAYLANQ